LLILIVENKNIEDNLSGTSMIIYVYHFMAFSLFAFVYNMWNDFVLLFFVVVTFWFITDSVALVCYGFILVELTRLK